MIIEEKNYVEHHGIKGMRWGVRKAQGTSSKSKANQNDHSKRNKRIAVGLGGAATVAAIAAGAFYAKKHFGVKVSDMPKPKKQAVDISKALAKEPVDIIHGTRAKDRGFRFLTRGGMNTSPLKEWDDAGVKENSRDFFKRYGTRNEKVAVTFPDPKGRKDFAGRVIPHTALIPESMAKGIKTREDAIKVAWPRLEKIYDAFYPSEQETLAPGF